MTIPLIEMQERLRLTLAHMFEEEGREHYWPAMFSEGLGCPTSEVAQAMHLMRRAGYLVEWFDLKCSQGHLICQREMCPLKDGDFSCPKCGQSTLEGTTAHLYFVMSEDWKAFLSREDV